nr:hypothetical protein [Tanacetum cinerariifolium]
MTVKKEKLTSLDGTTVMGYFPSLSTLGTTTAGNALDGFDAMLENGPWFIWNNPLILKKWHPDENLLKEDVSTVPVWVKLYGVPIMAFSEDGLSAIATKLGTPLMLDSYTSDMCMQSWGREGHYTCNVRVEYEWKPHSGNKKKGVEPTIKVSNSNPFDVLNSVDNDMEFEFASNTHIGEKIDKIERQIFEGKLRLLDNDGNPLVPTDGSDKGYDTNSLLEQLRDSYLDNDDYDPYDDDMYKNHDLSEHLQSICDDLDITVHGRKKK